MINVFIYIHCRNLLTAIFFPFRTKVLDDSKRKNVLHLVNLHYDKSAAIMRVLEYPLEYLRLQMERAALQEFIAESKLQNQYLESINITNIQYKKTQKFKLVNYRIRLEVLC